MWAYFGNRPILFIINRSFLNRCCVCCTIRLAHDKNIILRKTTPFSKYLFDKRLPSKVLKYSSANILLKTRVNEYSSNVDDLDLDNVNDLEDNFTSIRLRDFLYPGTKDPIIVSLKECCSVQEVFDIFEKYAEDLNCDQICQVVIVLWDLQRQFYSSGYCTQFVMSRNDVGLFKSFVQQITSHESFKTLVDQVIRRYDEMSPNALSCMILYLSKMGIDIRGTVLQKMINKTECLINNSAPGTYPLTALSRFCVALGQKHHLDLWAQFTLISTLPHIEHWLSSCEEDFEFRLLTICMFSTLQLLTKQMVKAYNDLVLRLLESGQLLKSEDLSILVKSIFLLNPPLIHNDPYHKTVIRLMEHLTGKLDKFPYFNQYVRLQKAYMYNLEPACLREDLKKCCSKWLESAGGDVLQINPTLLYCIIINTPHGKRYRYSEIASSIIAKADSLGDLFLMTTSSMRAVIHDSSEVWQKMYKYIVAEDNFDIVIGAAFRYLEMSPVSRNSWFENEMVSHLAGRLDNFHHIEPGKLAQIAMFMLAFSDKMRKDPLQAAILDSLFEKLFDNVDQFNLFDVYCLSRGRSLSLRQRGNNDHLHKFVKLDSALNARSVQLIDENRDMSIYDLNMICRSYINRGNKTNSALMEKLIERYTAVELSDISSKSLRNTIYNLVNINYLIPELMDLLVKYVILNKEIVCGSTVSKLLYGFYELGYTPEDEEFYKVAVELVKRDADMMAGLVLLQAALALSSANHLPLPLISYLFDIRFLDDLDEEIKHGYSKLVYPLRVRKCLMELNRSVCLDYPEADVPWFHGKFCQQETILLESKVRTPFSLDVERTLADITGDQKLMQQDVQSLYGYKIDFQLCLDKDNKIVPYQKGVDPVSKTAVLLSLHTDWTLNVRCLKGPAQTKRRHLEMLGYKVVSVDEVVWNSMFMTEPNAKHDYLLNLIKPS